MRVNLNIDPLMREQEVDSREMEMHIEFVRWYMYTRNAVEACLILGFSAPYAAEWAEALLAHGNVQRLIYQYEQQVDSDALQEERRRRYRSMMEKEAGYYGGDSKHSARVAAIAHLMKMEGMFEREEDKPDDILRGGVMEVPALTSADDWGQVAEQSQARLKQAARE